MARELLLPPRAASLSVSLRDLGYSLETAIADLIDNSISADATCIEIICDLSRTQPILAVIDNGRGMNSDEILSAMRHGTTSLQDKRAPLDLGRFGLGLKTASFSQCRRLTVLSSKHGTRCGAEWDLDQICQKDDWVITLLDPSDINGQPYAERLEDNGTIVIWRTLDRFFENESTYKRDEIVSEKLDIVEKHLSLVFHRFLSGEIKEKDKISISINGHPVLPFDPFCRKNTATQVLPEEIVRIKDSPVRMQPYILPHYSKLSARDYQNHQNRSDFISNQGAYIYRNGRLMAWGDWFRLIPKGEKTKLARVQIDFPSSLDELWTIDIKKSRARPPYQIRERLRQIITHISERSTTVHRGRGQRLFEEIKAPVWERYADHGGIHYALNSEHPLVHKLKQCLDKNGNEILSVLLESISASLPVEMIYSDFSINPRDVKQKIIESSEVPGRLMELKKVLFGSGETDVEVFREIIRSSRLFENHNEIVEKFILEEF